MLTNRLSSVDSRKPRKQPAPALKQRVLEAARALYFEGGVAGISARKIAVRLGCSATAIYLHYDGIGDVLHHLRMEGHAKLARALAEAPASLAPVERLIEMQRRYYLFGTENRDYFRLMFPVDLAATALTAAVREEAFSLDIVKQCAQEAIETGTLRPGSDATIVANVVWMHVHGLTATVVSGHSSATAEGREAEVLEALLEATRAWMIA